MKEHSSRDQRWVGTPGGGSSTGNAWWWEPEQKRRGQCGQSRRSKRQGREAHLHIGLIVAGLREYAGCRRGCQVPILWTKCAPVCLQQSQEVLGVLQALEALPPFGFGHKV